MADNVYVSAEADYYFACKPNLIAIQGASLAVRSYGKGPDLVFIHGYPTHGYTWRRLLPTLSTTFRCHVIDLPGLGDSHWDTHTDFTFEKQHQRLHLLLEQLVQQGCTLVAHDTGATLARMLAVSQSKKVKGLVIFNTEMPGHRPPWIQTYQRLAKLPGALYGFQLCMRSTWFLRSAMGMREFYANKALLTEEALSPYAKPLATNGEKMRGAIGYLQGIQWSVVDATSALHKQITAPVLLLWGQADRTFPLALAQQMSTQFAGPMTLIAIANAALLPHEEQPELVIHHILEFSKHHQLTQLA